MAEDMQEMAEDMQELSGDELDKISGGEKLRITTPIQAPPGAKERVGGKVRMEFLSGHVNRAIMRNRSLESVLVLCENENEKEFVRRLWNQLYVPGTSWFDLVRHPLPGMKGN